MSDNRRLKDKLLKLASEASSIEDGWRRILPRGGGGLVGAMVAEIDETVLAREIGFRNGRGDVLRLEAGNRRLKRLVAPAPDGLSGFAGLFGAAISEPTDETMEAMGLMFEKFAQGGDTLSVRSERPANDADAGLIGVSAAALAQAWSVSLGAPGQDELDQAFGAFAAAMVSAAVAWIGFESGEVAESSGGADYADWLENCRTVDWQTYLDPHNRQTLAAGGPVLCILRTEQASETHLLISGFGAKLNVSLVEGQSLAEITSTWRSLGL